ncbi:MAG: hypothetical protein F2634_06535, partial [Actinobacteria bacterium]|nr:hypothetical protein [Actinomycetota bacterium]
MGTKRANVVPSVNPIPEVTVIQGSRESGGVSDPTNDESETSSMAPSYPERQGLYDPAF